jgi:hypothetical protein
MGKYLGLVELGGTLSFDVLTRSGDAPLNASSAPTFRVYGSGGLMTNGTGTTAVKNSGSVTGATNASPISITSASHGLTTGTRVTITGVLGNTAANGTFNVTVVDANTFTLDSSSGNGPYTSGGTWNATGLYKGSMVCSAANGFESGHNFSILYNATVNSAAWADLDTFTVT